MIILHSFTMTIKPSIHKLREISTLGHTKLHQRLILDQDKKWSVYPSALQHCFFSINLLFGCTGFTHCRWMMSISWCSINSSQLNKRERAHVRGTVTYNTSTRGKITYHKALATSFHTTCAVRSSTYFFRCSSRRLKPPHPKENVF